jgi:tRNA dimethylallyltransferase
MAIQHRAGNLQQIVVIAGPTACGKSEITLLLAEQLGGEIVSVDSMQVYRGMDIGTAKPSAEERARVKHHLIDVADVRQRFDAAQFATLAHAAVADIHRRCHIAILCGGTGLYFRAFFEGLGRAPSADPPLRTELEQRPLEELLQELAEKDPATYAQIDRKNPRRIIRAVEVLRRTGQPFSKQKATWGSPQSPAADAAFALKRDLTDLHARINRRVDLMFEQGLVDETRRLLQAGLESNPTAMQALGYRQVVEHLHGERSLADTVELVKLRTRQFAKRQMTWFRRQMQFRWIDLESTQTASNAAAQIVEIIGGR